MVDLQWMYLYCYRTTTQYINQLIINLFIKTEIITSDRTEIQSLKNYEMYEGTLSLVCS